MSTAQQRPPSVTADELFAMSSNERYELVRGVLTVRERAGGRHGHIGAGIVARLWLHVRQHDLGFVFTSATGFHVARDPDTVRCPDVGFVRKARLPFGVPQGYLPFGPELAIEILSPSNRSGEMKERLEDLFGAGTAVAWVIDPAKRRAMVRRADGTARLLGENDVLDGEEIVPGFQIRVAELLEG